jgi:protein AFG1
MLVVPKGMYLYGDVGCGKTMLMDLFCKFDPSKLEDTLTNSADETIPEKFANSKRRVHFHAFMEDVHKRKHRLSLAHSAEQDVIVPIARQLAQEARILCFDEFQVLDIVDAMILRRLMESLMAYGVVSVITSKYVAVAVNQADNLTGFSVGGRMICTKMASSDNPSYLASTSSRTALL